MRFQKVFVSVLAIVALISGVTISHAAENNLINALDTPSTAAGWSSSVTTTGPSATSVTITFPILTSNEEKIMNYSVSYVKGKKITDADLTEINKKTFAGDKVVVDKDVASIVLDGLSAETTYYFVIIPINKEGTDLTPSDEVMFVTTKVGENTSTATTTANNGAGETLPAADTAGAQLTYVLSGSKVTLKWKSIAWVSKFQISMKEAAAKTYTNVGTEQVSKESYSFIIDKKGQFSVKIVPLDAQWAVAGGEKVLTVKVASVSAIAGKGTPATGVGMNLILMSTFLMMLMYVVYRFRTTK
jgi:hypothetical protein